MKREKCIDVVAIDGPAGSGKSTVARNVAAELGFLFLDTGAMYRAVALHAVKNNIGAVDNEQLQNLLNQINISFQDDAGLLILVNGEDVSVEIREPMVGKYASDYSTLPSVRNLCSRIQREIGEKSRTVAEGRDMGTVVFPDACWKFFLSASPSERARRRWMELTEKGNNIRFGDVFDQMIQRDEQDSKRSLAPLKPAVDAMLVDTTSRSVDDVVKLIVRKVREDCR